MFGAFMLRNFMSSTSSFFGRFQQKPFTNLVFTFKEPLQAVCRMVLHAPFVPAAKLSTAFFSWSTVNSFKRTFILSEAWSVKRVPEFIFALLVFEHKPYLLH